MLWLVLGGIVLLFLLFYAVLCLLKYCRDEDAREKRAERIDEFGNMLEAASMGMAQTPARAMEILEALVEETPEIFLLIGFEQTKYRRKEECKYWNVPVKIIAGQIPLISSDGNLVMITPRGNEDYSSGPQMYSPYEIMTGIATIVADDVARAREIVGNNAQGNQTLAEIASSIPPQ